MSVLQVFFESAPIRLSFLSITIHISSMRRTCSSSYSCKSGTMLRRERERVWGREREKEEEIWRSPHPRFIAELENFLMTWTCFRRKSQILFSLFLFVFLFLFLSMASPKNALILYNFNSYDKVSDVESQHLDTLARLGCSGRMHLEKIPEGKRDKKMHSP